MKQAIAVFITDTHLFERRTKEDELIENNIDLNISLYKQAVEIVKALGLNTLYHGGDIFHSRKSQTQTLFKVFQKKILDEIFEVEDIDLIAIPGNHDKTDYTDTYSFLSPFLHHPRFHLHEDATQIALSKEVMLYLVPFFDDEQYSTCLNVADHQANLKTKNVLLTHVEIKGALTNGGEVTDKGISQGDYCKFDQVLVGHFHNRNSINSKIHYIGAAYQHNFGEDEKKGVCILYDDLSIEYIDLEFPKYIRKEIGTKDLTSKEITKLAKQAETDHIKVILTGAANEIDAFDRTALKSVGILVEKKVDTVVKENIDKLVDKFDNLTLQKHFQTFCTKNGLDQITGQKYLDKVL